MLPHIVNRFMKMVSNFFSFSILSYVLHGWLKDTTNQFRQPHQMGRWHLPKWMLSSAMIFLVIGEI